MSLILSISLVYFIYRIFTCREGKLFAIKEFVAQCYLKFKRGKRKSRLDNYDHFHTSDVKKVNILPPDEERDFEHRKPDDQERSDGIFLFGFNSKGERLVSKIDILGSRATVWVQLKTEDGKKYVLPGSDRVRNVPQTDASSFAAAGLRMKCLVPFRRWRISFNGILREEDQNNSTKDVHVKFSFVWIASSAPIDNIDVPNSELANYLAGVTWNGYQPPTNLIPTLGKEFNQAGNLMGTVIIDGGDEKEVLLWGARVRSVDDLKSTSKVKEYLVHTLEGEYICLKEIICRQTGKKFIYGFIVHSNSLEKLIENARISNVEGVKDELRINFNSGKIEFALRIGKTEDATNLPHSMNSQKCKVSFSEAELNGACKGNAITVEKERYERNISNDRSKKDSIFYFSKDELTLNIWEGPCKKVKYTGGKGSSLAQLREIARNNSSFEVPDGFVVTTAAYQTFLLANKVKEIIKETGLEDVAWEKVTGDLKSVCEKTVGAISEMELPNEVRVEIEEKMSRFQNSTLFAVRSSASGEDSEEMSAAGQMETFLGVRGSEQVLDRIVKCWASQFSYSAVQYKKQNGQELNSPMAVVVQEMVGAEQAGVMFTCNPLTGNPQNIIITANYGLGESVVSASSEPDTIDVSRDVEGKVQIGSVQIGSKTKKISMAESGGVSEEDVEVLETSKCCISTENALNLAKLGVDLEEAYGCSLDVEWALVQDKIFLLQARPVTTFDRETDFEIIHETDSHLRCENECMTKANVGEVMPGAMTELGMNFLNKMLEMSMQNHWTRRNQKSFPVNPYLQKALTLSSKHVFFNVTDTLYRFQKGKEKSSITKAYEIAMFGRTLEDEELKEQATKRNTFYPPTSAMKNLCFLIRDLYALEKRLQVSTKYINEYQLRMNEDATAEEYFYQIIQKILEAACYTSCHTESTFSSSIYTLVLLSVLAKANKGEWNDKVFSEIAKLLSCCKEVESADVPYAIQELAVAIKDSVDADEFRSMSVESATVWLQTPGTLAATRFEDLIKKHGHRCVKEFDLETSPWRDNPTSLVKSLQEMVKTVRRTERPKKDVDDIIANVQLPLTWKSRLMLKLVVPFCQTAVGRRERSKSVMIKTVDIFRKGFRALGLKMAHEGRLPDASLVFYLTIPDLAELLKSRSPKLVQKAIRRKQLHPKVNEYRFPEVVKGLARPVQLQTALPEQTRVDFVLKGTPVSQGVVTARVRVANNLDEAADIRPGEILVAYSTDIGWSPYFPMLSGVATELGGLISHGAVVAREYGLPCVVALHGATTIFKTGELVVLDGNRGTLQRVLE